MTISVPTRRTAFVRGFSLIELLVAIALAAILASLAAPSVRDFIVRSKITNLGNEFSAGIMKARNEAVNRNVCVTLCMSSSADDRHDNDGKNGPKCTTANKDWQVGWIAFLNPSCDSDVIEPAAIDMVLARTMNGTDYSIQAQGSTKNIMFNPRGVPGLGSADQFNIIYQDISNPLNDRYAFNICMDGLGRTRTLPFDKNCAGYK